jgi:hypothetical protein
VLSELSPGFLALGYDVESGKTQAAKIRRPVLLGEDGNPEVNYEIDAFHDELVIPAYERTRNQLHAIYASQRLKLPFEGVLLIGH